MATKKKYPAKPTTAHLNKMGLFTLQCLSAGAEEHGHPCLDQKRPYGSSGVEYDVLDHLNLHPGDDATAEEEEAAHEYASRVLKALPLHMIMTFRAGLKAGAK